MFIEKKIDNFTKKDNHQQIFLPNSRCVQPVQIVSTIYGSFTITEPILLSLLSCPSLQRLKKINQYGVDFFIGSKKVFTRYDHSLGVFCLLRKFQLPLREQIAGLLHDVSHTVFSHVGDTVYDHRSATSSYQDDIHEWFLNQTEISEILEQYGFTVADILPKNTCFQALEQNLPELCADRLDYNLFGGVVDQIIKPEEVIDILKYLHFNDGRWFFSDQMQARRVAMLPLHLTEHHFGSAQDLLMNYFTGQLLKYARSIHLLSDDDIHFSTDKKIWEIICASSDQHIQALVQKLYNSHQFSFGIPENHDLWLPSKNRGIDPWVHVDNEYVRLSVLDSSFKQEYVRVKNIMENGWYFLFD